VQCAESTVQGAVCRVHCAGCSVQSPLCRVQCAESTVQGEDQGYQQANL
jgi:hypothetical protein